MNNMKKFKNLLTLVFLSGVVFSCEKHTIEYKATTVDAGTAEFQLHYFVPVNATTANNIYKVEVNGQMYANSTAPLSTYNAVPSGAVGRFYTTKAGQNNFKLYMGENLDLVYDQNCDLKGGYQNIFVYDFSKPPIVFENGYPYVPEVTAHTGKTAWIKFYNFLFESGNQTTNLKLQYQYQYVPDPDNAPTTKTDWINLGKAVSFGEATDWVPIPVIKRADSLDISSGTARIDYRAMVVNPDGSMGDQLQVMNASGNMVPYTDWWNAGIGRRYHHILSGMRADKPTCAVRLFTAL